MEEAVGEAQETRWAELDPRSLALFRVMLGVLVLLTLLSSVGDWTAFFTDAGVLPRDVLVGSGFADAWLCFHLGSGGLATQVVLNTLLGALACGLILGWRTWWMTLGCWVLLNSLQVRNPFICDRGDLELSLMLFWALFLPLGQRWSLDQRANRPPLGQAQGLAAAALVLQFAQIYLFAAYLKNGPFWLARGDGLEYSLLSPLFGTTLSFELAKLSPQLLYIGNYLVLAGELFVGLLLLSPWFVSMTRTFAVALLLGFHLCIAAVFQLGLFPWIGALLPLVLLPKEFWVDGWGVGPAKSLSKRLEGFGPQMSERLGRWGIGARNVFLTVCISLTLLCNFAFRPNGFAFERSDAILFLTDTLRLTQHWELFSPAPPYQGTFKLLKVGASGETSTIFEGPPTPERPSLASFPSHRWRMIMVASLFPDYALVRPGLARLLARREGSPPSDHSTLEYKFEVRLVGSDGKLEAPQVWPLWRQNG